MARHYLAALVVALPLAACAAGTGPQGPDERTAQAVIDGAGAPCGRVVNTAWFRGSTPAGNLMAVCSNGIKYALLRTPAMGWDLGVYDQRTDSVRPWK